VQGRVQRDTQREASSVTRISPYLHVLDGRLRIKLPQVKGAPQRARAVEQLLLGLNGVTNVTANPTTGNVLVLFTSAVIGQHDIIAALQKTGYLRDDNASEQDRKSFTSMVVQSALELVIERLVLALI
jgi:heavy-metal-associated domain-containing protein